MRKKQSSFDRASAKESLGLDQSATPMEITSAVLASRNQQQSNQTPRSPLKEAVKRQNRMLIANDEERQKELEELRAWTTVARGKIEEQKSTIKTKEKDMKILKRDSNHLDSFKKQSAVQKQKLKENLRIISSLEAEKIDLESMQKQSVVVQKKLKDDHNRKIEAMVKEQCAAQKDIEKLKETTKSFSQQLKAEKAASRATIAKVMSDAEAKMADATAILRDASKKEKELEVAEKSAGKEAAREERQWASRSSAIGK